MRVFSFHWSTMRAVRPRRTGAARQRAARQLQGAALAVLAALTLPGTASATQWPGELSGRIVDSLTRTPLGAVEVLVEPGAWRTSTDASGGFRLRGLEPGSHRVSVSRLGYISTYRDVEVQNGGVAQISVELIPMALELVGITATVAGAGGITSTLEDMTRYVQFLLDPAGVEAPLKPATLDEMLGAPIEPHDEGSRHQRISWMGSNTEGRGPWFMHGGEVDGHSSYLAFSRERALGIVVLSNLGGRAADGLGGWLERELPGLKPF